MAYQTAGIAWWADYNLVYREGSDANTCKLDVGAWVSIINQSGAGYPDAKLKLIAGDVQRVRPAAPAPAMALRRSAAMEERAAGFEEKEFFEYHLYTLGRPTSLPDNSTKQIELFAVARNVACEKTLVYRWVNWQIASRTHDFQKQDARTIHFPLKIAAGGEVTLRYSVQYSW